MIMRRPVRTTSPPIPCVAVLQTVANLGLLTAAGTQPVYNGFGAVVSEQSGHIREW